MHEVGSIDVMRLERRSASRVMCLRIKLNVDENFPPKKASSFTGSPVSCQNSF
jgi:hypothetical protein